ncbi:MAG: group III truncated hemoglobin [Tranquillimonas sp.]
MPTQPRIREARSLRPEATARLIRETGLTEEVLTRLVHGFYDRVRDDPLLAPVFAARIVDWPPHLDRMVDFWSSVMLMTGRYRGTPVQAHLPLPLDAAHFERWLTLFARTAHEVCPPEGAAHIVDRAQRIAASLQAAIQGHRRPDEG